MHGEQINNVEQIKRIKDSDVDNLEARNKFLMDARLRNSNEMLGNGLAGRNEQAGNDGLARSDKLIGSNGLTENTDFHEKNTRILPHHQLLPTKHHVLRENIHQDTTTITHPQRDDDPIWMLSQNVLDHTPLIDLNATNPMLTDLIDSNQPLHLNDQLHADPLELDIQTKNIPVASYRPILPNKNHISLQVCSFVTCKTKIPWQKQYCHLHSVKRCIQAGCSKRIVSKGLCSLHGGRRLCTFNDDQVICRKIAIGDTMFCTKHGSLTHRMGNVTNSKADQIAKRDIGYHIVKNVTAKLSKEVRFVENCVVKQGSNAFDEPLKGLVETHVHKKRKKLAPKGKVKVPEKNISVVQNELFEELDKHDTNEQTRWVMDRKLCAKLNCSRYSVGRTSYCIRHGGGKRCTIASCDKGAVKNGLCSKHGGKLRCSYQQNGIQCTKQSIGRTKFCTKHGKFIPCIFVDSENKQCKKRAIGTSQYCGKHGGGNRCGFLMANHYCTKKALGSTLFCAKHGGGLKCTVEHCVNRRTKKNVV